METDIKLIRLSVRAQRLERTEYLIYSSLAKSCRHEGNAAVLRNIAAGELRHAEYWAKETGRTEKPKRLRAFFYIFMGKFLGLTFAMKLMEKGESKASLAYKLLGERYPEALKIAAEEDQHEEELLAMLDEERLAYVGSIVLGLNDALVELTGALAGFTLALADTRIISLAGLITGISAAFSMAASDYLSSKAENNPRAAKSAIYTGVAYIITVAFLIAPFLLLQQRFLALGITLSTAVAIIAGFNYYISVAKDLNFRRRFLEMALISIGVAAFSFGLGFLLKQFLGVEV